MSVEHKRHFMGFLACSYSWRLRICVGSHFEPFLAIFLEAWPCPRPRGSFGWPILGETLPFLNPHPSNSLVAFLKDHCSR
jgi:hypothetical protein